MIRLRLVYLAHGVFKPSYYNINNIDTSDHKKINNKYIVQHEKNTMEFGSDVSGFQILVRRKIDFTDLPGIDLALPVHKTYGGTIKGYYYLYDDKIPADIPVKIPAKDRVQNHDDPQFMCFSSSVLYTSLADDQNKYTLPTFMMCNTLEELEKTVDFELIFYSKTSDKPYETIVPNRDGKYVDLVLNMVLK